MNSDFYSDREVPAAELPVAKLIDPEAYDASEQQFAASLDVASEAEASDARANEASVSSTADAAQADVPQISETNALSTPENSSASDAQPSWRQEVSERVSKYRRKSPREPRYPSLQLKFESSQAAWSAPPRTSHPVSRDSVALDSEIKFEEQLNVQSQPDPDQYQAARLQPEPEIVDNLIEFPRFLSAPVSRPDELAEPVQDRLRIIEAPEVTPPPPALGGILIEPVEQPDQERRPGFDIPLQSSSLSRRFAAAFTDALIVAAAVAFFGYIFLRLGMPALTPLRLAVIGIPLAALFWIAYQYLFLVHTGSTPGLRIAKLRIACFDGTNVARAARRWRVIASVLSGISLGLGFLWCFLDEDQLCWHDRITRTHLAPKSVPAKD